MKDPAAIRRYRAIAAQRNQPQPYHPETLEDLALGNPAFCIPVLGAYLPPGWRRTEETWLVDKTGSTRPRAPALTIPQFLALLRDHFVRHPTAGYAVIADEELQLRVAAFERLSPQAGAPSPGKQASTEAPDVPVEFAYLS